jgi:hypothetical protein
MEQRIKAALGAETLVSVSEMPLADVARQLARQHRIPIEVDKKGLDNVGVDINTPVSRNLSGVSLRSALRLILRDMGLTYKIRDEVLLITSTEEAEKELLTVVYPVTDLVRPRDAQGPGDADYNTLIDTISSAVAPQTWSAVGGPSDIQALPVSGVDTIVISQTEEVHEQIESLLKKLREISGAQKEDGQPRVKEKPDGPSPVPSFHKSSASAYGGLPALTGTGKSAASASGNLLQGLQEKHRQLQRGQINKLQDRFKQGMGMGGMGGFSAGGMY